MIIGIFGNTCTGKSTVAGELARAIRIDVRHCGELIKAVAISNDRSPSDLTNAEHEAIDGETRRLAEGTEDVIVEGTFLDAVLKDTENCVLVKLTCETAERKLRHQKRGQTSSYEHREAADAALRDRLYGQVITRVPQLEIDTTGKTPAAVAKEIARWISAKR